MNELAKFIQYSEGMRIGICHELGHAMYLLACNITNIKVSVGIKSGGDTYYEAQSDGECVCIPDLDRDDDMKYTLAGYVMQSIVTDRPIVHYRNGDMEYIRRQGATNKEIEQVEKELREFLTPYKDVISHYARETVKKVRNEASKEGKVLADEIFKDDIAIPNIDILALYKFMIPPYLTGDSTNLNELLEIEKQINHIGPKYWRYKGK